MTLQEAIKARRSIRAYKPEPVSQDKIDALLEAAMLAPSANNSRPWEFVVVTSRDKLDALVAVHPYAQMLRQAPAAIIVCALPEASAFVAQDCGAATENLLLQAADLGLGTCWCGVFPREELMAKVQKALGIKAVPFNIIALGVPNEAPPIRGKYDKSKVTYL